MNIFYLDHDPAVAAMYMHDRHVVKMCLETAQILCTVYHRYGKKAPYKPTHANHPCVLWAGDHIEHFHWLVRHGEYLCLEYTTRFGKAHASHKVIRAVGYPPAEMYERVRVQKMPPQCMPDEYKIPGQTVLAYRNYYLGAKVAGNRWTKRARPNFVIQGEAKMAKKQKKEETVVETTEGTTETVVETPAAEPKEPAAPRSRGPRGVGEEAVITVLAESNPKRPSSKAYEAFAQYRSGMTVKEFCDAVGKEATGHLVYDTSHGFISIEGYTPGQIIKPKEKAPKAPKEPKARKPKATKDAEAAVDEDLATAEEEA